MKRVDKELLDLRSNIKSLSKPGIRLAGKNGVRATEKKSYANEDSVFTDALDSVSSWTENSNSGKLEDQGIGESFVNVRDERLVEYLSSSFHSPNSLRHERQIQRNKAIFLVVIVLIVFLWTLWRFFFL